MKKAWMIVAAWMILAAAARAGLVFSDDFEGKPYAETGNPEGWTIFGAPLDDRGTLHNGENHSPTAAVWVAFTWTSWGWGATTVSNEAVRYDVLNDFAEMSVWMRGTNAFAAPSVALTIYDADGTQWRTADADLFQLTANWAAYTTRLADMVVEVNGNTPGLDYANITHVGFLAFTAGQSGQNVLQYDDFRMDSIPEPSTVVALLMGFGLLAWRARRR